MPQWASREGQAGLLRGRHLPRSEDAALQCLPFYRLIVPHERVPYRAADHPHVPAQDAVRDRALGDVAPRLDRDVRPDRHVVQRDAFFHVDRGHDGAAGTGAPGQARPAPLEQVAVRLEQRVHLAAVVPPRGLPHAQPPATVHHVLKRVRQVELAALAGWLLQHVRDALEQRLPILDVLQPDVRQPGHGGVRLLDDPPHVASAVRHDHPEAAVVLDLLGPDDPMCVRRLDEREVGVEQGVHEDDQDRTLHVGPREIDRSRRAVQRLLFDESRLDVVMLDDVALDDAASNWWMTLGWMWNDSPSRSGRSISVSPCWIRSTISPFSTWIDSSFLLWYCRLRTWPGSMWRILPT